jgi:hypothetical protein
VITFGMRLRQVAADFVRLEELVAEQGRAQEGVILRIGVLNGRMREAREVIAVPRERRVTVAGWVEQILAALGQPDADEGEEGRRLRLAALTEAAERYLAPAREREEMLVDGDGDGRGERDN